MQRVVAIWVGSFVSGGLGCWLGIAIAAWLSEFPNFLGGPWWEVLAALFTASAVVVALSAPWLSEYARSKRDKKAAVLYMENEIAYELQNSVKFWEWELDGVHEIPYAISAIRNELDWILQVDLNKISIYDITIVNDLSSVKRCFLTMPRLLDTTYPEFEEYQACVVSVRTTIRSILTKINKKKIRN